MESWERGGSNGVERCYGKQMRFLTLYPGCGIWLGYIEVVGEYVRNVQSTARGKGIVSAIHCWNTCLTG